MCGGGFLQVCSEPEVLSSAGQELVKTCVQGQAGAGPVITSTKYDPAMIPCNMTDVESGSLIVVIRSTLDPVDGLLSVNE